MSETKEMIQLANLNIPSFTASFPSPPKDPHLLDQLFGGGGGGRRIRIMTKLAKERNQRDEIVLHKEK